MGEVWKAQDSRLGRTVAVKFSKEEFTDRFEREAKSIAALNHPNICTLYDVGPNYLVMEYVEGTPLTGPLPHGKVLLYAGQICDALHAAHRKGITHRDLKPGNILITSQGAKLLDFGLAKSLVAAAGTQDETAVLELTGQGVVLGTPQYMSPEQVEGKPADQRSDIFALGCVLYEMVTGKKAFEGATATSVAGAILAKEPEPVRALQPATPASLERVILACLRKDPEERFQSARDVKLALAWQAAEISPAPKQNRWMWPATAAVLVAVAAFLSFRLWTRPELKPRPVHFTLDRTGYTEMAAPSPDGSLLLMREEGPKGRLVLHSIETGARRALASTDGAAAASWSPDNRKIAFTVADPSVKLKVLDLSNGSVETRGQTGRGRPAWNGRGDILMSSAEGLMLHPATGAEPRRITKVDRTRESLHYNPLALPGAGLLYLSEASMRQVAVHIEEDGRESGRLNIEGNPVFLSSTGHLIAPSGALLRARRLDVRSWTFQGDAKTVGGPIAYGPREARFAASDHVLTWSEAPLLENVMMWFDRQGNVLGTLGDRGDYSGPALSPDGNRLAVALRDRETGTRDLWLFDVANGAGIQLTSNHRDDFNAVWSPDGTRIAFTSDRSGTRSLYILDARPGAVDELLLQNGDALSAESWTPDGRTMIFTTSTSGSGQWALGHVPVDPANRKDELLIRQAREGHLSPDGRWLAFARAGRDPTDRNVWLSRYPPEGAPRQISEPGDPDPQWARNTGELFYTSYKHKKLMAVRLSASGEPSKPEPLFDLPAMEPLLRNNFTVSPDGQRFLFVASKPRPAVRPIHVLMNWSALLR
jgi:Tol biopolymer transport system component